MIFSAENGNCAHFARGVSPRPHCRRRPPRRSSRRVVRPRGFQPRFPSTHRAATCSGGSRAQSVAARCDPRVEERKPLGEKGERERLFWLRSARGRSSCEHRSRLARPRSPARSPIFGVPFLFRAVTKFAPRPTQNAVDADFGCIDGLSRERRGGSEGRRERGIQRNGPGPSGPTRGVPKTRINLKRGGRADLLVGA